jgi:choline dehydrogenase-like flavoprotein
MDDIVIGSGPAGVSAAWALIKQGRNVTMLDVGEQLEKEKSDLRSRLASIDPEDWLTDDIRSFTHSRRSGEIEGMRPFGSDILLRDPVGFFEGRETNPSIGVLPSFAAGGFSNGWGSAILPYRQEDIMDWPASTRELDEHYGALREFMPMTGLADHLKDLFPKLSMPMNTALPLSHQAETLLKRLETKRETLNQSGIFFGQARKAVYQACRKCGMCLYGCPYGVIYNATQTRDILNENAAFSYQKGFCISRLEEDDGSVRLWAFDIANREEVQFSAKRVFVACGVLPTARLLMNSLEYFNKPIAMKDSQHFFLPLLHSWKSTQAPCDEHTNSLVQLFVEIIDPECHDKTAHAQIYTFNDLYEVDMRKRFGPFANLFTPLIRQLSQRLIVAQGFLHSDYSSQIELSLITEESGQYLRMEERINAKTKDAISRIQKKLGKLSREAGVLPLTRFGRKGIAGSSFHCGSTFPMRDRPTGLESDTLGRPAGLQRVFVVDASVLPSIPATTITLSVMANAHRIATESAHVSA